jgi:hypothetical protein
MALMSLGARCDVGFEGAVDEFQVFDRDLTPLEVAAVAGISAPTSAVPPSSTIAPRDAKYQATRDEL